MQPRLSREFTAVNKRGHTEELKKSVARLRDPEISNNNLKSRGDLDHFDGDDLQLDDFLATNERYHTAKDYSRPRAPRLDDADWISITSGSPSPPKQGSKGPISHEDDWTAELGEHLDEEYEPIRLANGKWACNHKCKDKTRFADISSRLEMG
jgi:ATP-dependent DNA helicase HFM1/MER3